MVTRKLITFMSTLALSAALTVPAQAAPGALTFVETDTGIVPCDPMWENFYAATWQNNTGSAIWITKAEMDFVSAQSLVGQFAAWFELAHDAANSPPTGPIIDAFGTNIYAPPIQAAMKQTDFGNNYFVVPAGAWLTLKSNCGPTYSTGGFPQSTNFGYVGVLRFWYVRAQ